MVGKSMYVRAVQGLTLGLVLVVAAVAQAEMTVENLVGKAVVGVGPYYQDVADAIRKHASRDYDGALKNLQAAKKTVPGLPPAEVMMAQLYLDGGQVLQANAMLEQAIKTAPQDPEALVILAERAIAEGRLTEAGLLYQRAAKVAESFTENPRRRQDLLQRILGGGAGVDEKRGDLKEAKTKLEALIRLDQRDAAAHEKMGRVLFALGDQRHALDEFKLAAETDPKALPAGLAMAYLVTDRAAAEKWLNYAIGQGGNDLRTQVAVAGFLLRNNQIEAAMQHAEKALAIDAENLDANLIAGLVARLQADYPKAVKYLSKAHLLSPTHPAALNNLALVLLESPDADSKQRALAYADLGVKYNSNQVEALTTLGWINYRMKRRREADRAFSAVMNSPEMANNMSMTSEMAYYLANFARDQGNVKEAIQLLTDALNTEMPFGYRKAAEDLLAQLTKLEKPAARSKSDKPAAGAKPAEAAAKPSGAPADPAPKQATTK